MVPSRVAHAPGGLAVPPATKEGLVDVQPGMSVNRPISTHSTHSTHSKVAVLLLVFGVACAASDSVPPDSVPLHLVTGRTVAGPVCPVETNPPDPACAPRSVSGAVIEVFDEEGDLIATVTTDGAGTFAVELADGRYQLVPSSVEGLLGTAASIELAVAGQPVEVGNLVYDTGIR